jgi:hypothetical protein
MKKVLGIAILLVVCGCKKEQGGLTLTIERFKKRACEGAMIIQYDYDSSKIYEFYDGCSRDGYNVITDDQGNEICTVNYSSASTSNPTCLGKPFATTKKNSVVIYQK